MGFITTYILLTFLGYVSHIFYHKYGLPKGKTAWIAYYSMLTVGGLLLLDILIYIGILDFIFPVLNNIPWVSIDNGKDFMWNSFQFIGIDFGIIYTNPGMNSLAVIFFLSYVPWYVFGKLNSKIMFGGSRRYEEGFWWALGPTKKPKKDEVVIKAPVSN